MPSYLRGTTMDDDERARQGMTIRRAVLGDEQSTGSRAARSRLEPSVKPGIYHARGR